jgi:hypothetical protein
MKAKPAFGTVALFLLGVLRTCSLVGTERETLQVLTSFWVVADLGRFELTRGSSIQGLIVKRRRALASVFSFSVHLHGITVPSIETVEATISTRFTFIGKVILFIVDLFEFFDAILAPKAAPTSWAIATLLDVVAARASIGTKDGTFQTAVWLRRTKGRGGMLARVSSKGSSFRDGRVAVTVLGLARRRRIIASSSTWSSRKRDYRRDTRATIVANVRSALFQVLLFLRILVVFVNVGFKLTRKTSKGTDAIASSLEAI